MGFEYKIAFRAGDPVELESFLAGLRTALIKDPAQPDFAVALEADGFYFCDSTKSAISSAAFRRLIDEGLNHSEVIVHEL